ncbi:hypothetical protein BGZ83_011431 [Gryganskiella cystojenkinii]|nr:hypothetical protein BGZ83_011431 [Gryganskiella cystojenkinii]
MGSINSREAAEDAEQFHSPEAYHETRPLLARYYNGDNGVPRPFPTAPVTALIKEARYSIINALDTSLTRDELGSPEIYLALLLPIVRKYREERKETAAVYCFLLNRWQFLKDAEEDLANARLNETRAHACEIVATKVLKAFTLRQLIDVLTYDFSPVKRKDARSRLYLPHFEGEPSTEPMSALEVAISGRAKHFISNPLVQEIINQIWLGQIVFFSNAIDNPDSCLHASQQEIRTVTVYDSRDIKFLRLSRLRVPRYKTTFQMVSFSAFILVYTVVTFAKETELTTMEVIMDLFALSFTLDEFLQLKDSGPSFYFETVWNLFDVPIYIIFLGFMGLRISTYFTGSADMNDFAYDFLACNAILLWPRLFAALGSPAFYTLHDNTKSYGEIAWLLLQVFFGSAFLGFEQADELSILFGAPLMVLFVAISVLMLYTLLISIFSQTFSEVSANAKEEFMFLFSVKVMEEVKSDALYEFQPPFNILAGIFVWPFSLFYPPEVVGRLSRVLLRFFYFPELVGIWLFETLVMQKHPQYLPIRPGVVEHEGNYGATGSSREPTSSTAGGGVAKRRQEAIDGLSKASQVESTREDGASPMEVDNTAMGDPFQVATAQYQQEQQQQDIQQQQTQKQLNRLTTNGLNSNNLTEHEILSPYFENIRRFRDASKSNSTASLRSGSEHDQEQSPYTPYSYHPPPMPVGIGIARHGSMSGYGGYGRVRQGTEATLANTYQSMWPANGMTGDMSFLGGGAQFPQQRQQWFADQEAQQQQQQFQSNDAQELARLVDERFSEMRIHMEELESKLDRLINAILVVKDDK